MNKFFKSISILLLYSNNALAVSTAKFDTETSIINNTNIVKIKATSLNSNYKNIILITEDKKIKNISFKITTQTNTIIPPPEPPQLPPEPPLPPSPSPTPPPPKEPVISLELPQINIETSYVGDIIKSSIVIKNTGEKPLIISNIILSELLSLNITLPVSILPNQSLTVELTYLAKNTGNFSSEIIIESNAENNKYLKIPVSINVNLPNPTNNDLCLWLKADEGILTSSSNKISFWTDFSGKSHNATSEKHYKKSPVYLQNIINNLPTVSFINNDHLNIEGVFDDFNTGLTAFVVSDKQTIDKTNYAYFAFENTKTNKFISWCQNNLYNTDFYISYNNKKDWHCFPYETDYSGFIISTVSQINDVKNNKSYITIWINNIYINTLVSSIPEVSMMNKNYIGTTLNEKIDDIINTTLDKKHNKKKFQHHKNIFNLSEMLIYKRTLTDKERETVTNYLNGKYKIFAFF